MRGGAGKKRKDCLSGGRSLIIKKHGMLNQVKAASTLIGGMRAILLTRGEDREPQRKRKDSFLPDGTRRIALLTE